MKAAYSLLLCATLVGAASLQEAETLYEAQNYLQAKSLSEKLLKEHPDDVELHLVAARSALAMQELRSAVLHAKAVIEIDPALPEAYTVIGDALTADGQPDRAKRFYKIAKRLQKTGASPHQLNVLVSVGAGYDTNVNSHPGIGRMNEYYVLETVVPSTVTKRKSAAYIQEMLFADHRYDADRKSPFSYKTQIMLLNKDVIDESDYNAMVLNLKSGPYWHMGTYDIWLPLKAGTMRYGNNAYSNTYAVEPSYIRTIASHYRLSVNVKAERTVYDDRSMSGYDNERWGGLIGVERSFGTQKLYLGYRYFDASARYTSTSLTYADNTDHGVSVKYTQTFSPAIRANLQYHYDRKRFEDVTYTASSEKRKDRLSVVKAELNYTLDNTSFVHTALKYVNNDSNYIPLDYDRTDLMISYNKLF